MNYYVIAWITLIGLASSVPICHGRENEDGPPDPMDTNDLSKPLEQEEFSVTDDVFASIRPAIYLFLRFKETISKAEIERLVRAAILASNSESEGTTGPWVENVILIEEESHWVVSFHGRSNGRVVRKDPINGSFEWFVGPLFIPVLVYIDKITLEPIRPSHGAIVGSPAFQDPFPLELEFDYPKRNEAEIEFSRLSP